MKARLVKWLPVSLSIFFFILAVKTGALCWASETFRFSKAQEVVESIVSKHPDLVRLTIHGVPTGEQGSRIIACNIKEKIGKLSDSEDLEAMKTGKTVTLKEGDNLDVTAPIYDRAGKPIAATGITLRFREGETEDQVAQRAKAIAEEVTAAVRDADTPLW